MVDTIHRAERFSEEDWRKDMETNLHGAFYLAQAAFEALAASGDGRVVLISSVAAETGIPARSPTARRRRVSSAWRERWQRNGPGGASAAT